MPQFNRHFTRAEAQELIPWIRNIFARVQLIFDSAQPAPAESQAAAIATKRRTIAPNGNGSCSHAHTNTTQNPEELVVHLAPEEKQTLLRGLVKAILDRGIIIQDVRRGLIDFPAWKDSREVLLCYELDDGEFIRFWHEVDAGYAGRQKLGDWA